MAFTNPTVSDFQNYFVRDFPYGVDPNTCILDADISKAFGQTNININKNLFSTQEAYTIAYLLLAAHYLVVDLRMSSQGINGQYNFLETSKSVGSVNQSFTIPQRILDNPYVSMLTKTSYGAKYLELILPQLSGQVFITYGRTLP